MLAPVAHPEIAARTSLKKPAKRVRTVFRPRRFPETLTESSLLLPIITSSFALHLILVGFFGAGVPKPAIIPVRTALPPPPSAVRLIEEVKLEPETVQLKDLTTPPEDLLPADSTDVPGIARVEPITAVPVSVPVSFGVKVNGPVRLVDDAALASGAIGGRPTLAAPISLDGENGQEKSLLLPTLPYPAEALQSHEAGIVEIEFHANATGDVHGVKIHTSSGLATLDNAALGNVRRGRWIGAAGFYVKRFEFRLN